jgi:hypothetical protein
MEITQQDIGRWPPRWAITLLGTILLIVGALGTLASPFAILAAPFLFDAPGSDKNPIMFYFLGGLLALPFVSIATIVASWKAARRGSRAGLAVAAVLVFGWAAYMAAVNYTLDVKCGGMFSCSPADAAG